MSSTVFSVSALRPASAARDGHALPLRIAVALAMVLLALLVPRTRG